MLSILYILPIAFIVVLIKQDQREWPGFSLPLWIPLLWYLFSSTRLIQILFSGNTEHNIANILSASVEGNPIGRMISLVLLLVGIVIMLNRKKAFVEIFRANRGIMIFYAYALLSIAWSEYPVVSLKKFIRICGSLLIAFIVTSEEDHHEALEHVFRRYAAICLTLSMFFIRTDRSIGYIIGVHGEHFMAGIASHKNELGILSAFSFVFLLWRALRTWPKINYLDAMLLLVSVYFLIRAQSATALVVALMGMLLLMGLKLSRGRHRNILILAMVLAMMALPVLFIVINSPGASVSGLFYNSFGRDGTLTGRIPMWQDLMRIGRVDKVQGSGYESFWISHLTEIWQLYSFGPTNAHSGFVDVFLNLGLIGFAIIAIIFIRSLFLVCSEASLSHPYGIWNFSALVMIIFNNITESALLNLSLSWALFLAILANGEKDRIKRAPKSTAPELNDHF